MKTLALVVAAALGGALIVVACSDDSPPSADAAVCDCPAAEPPITAARLHRVGVATATAAPNSIASPSASCPDGELLISGSCYLDVDNTVREVTLTYAGQIPSDPSMQATTWRCDFTNKSATETAIVRAQAVCLRLAP